MRRLVATLLTILTILLFAPELLARGNHGWEHVEKLKPGSLVLISLWSGETLSGHVVAVSPTALRLSTSYPVDTGTGPLPEVGRATIRRIVHVRRPKLPDPERWMLTGALVGGGIGLVSGAIDDATHHDSTGHWITGGLGGAGIGFFGSCAALAGVGTAALFRHNTVVYEDNRAGRVAHPFANEIGVSHGPP